MLVGKSLGMTLSHRAILKKHTLGIYGPETGGSY